ncbi:MAG: RimK family alpha-L-glutamate ligase [Planctomycetota bacterium]
MTRRACILGEPGGWHARRLAAGLDGRGFTTAIVRWQALRAAVALDGPRVGPPEFAAADVIAVRGMPGTSPVDARLEEVILRMDILGRLAAAGTPVVNPPRALEIAIDKYLTLAHLAEAGLPVPRTIVAQDAASAARARAELGGDCVIKPLFGSRGRGLVRVLAGEPNAPTPDTGGVVYLQEFIPHHGWDVRVLVVGERLFAMRRRAAPGEWRTNLAVGGHAEPLDLPDGWGDLARRAATAVGAPLAGVDLLPARDGRLLVLEVNAVPGWRGLEAVAGPEVAHAVTDHVVAACRV